MIHLDGMTMRDEQHPEGDIEITYTGLHLMILRAIEDSLPGNR
jgi:hypothetical protein